MKTKSSDKFFTAGMGFLSLIMLLALIAFTYWTSLQSEQSKLEHLKAQAGEYTDSIKHSYTQEQLALWAGILDQFDADSQAAKLTLLRSEAQALSSDLRKELLNQMSRVKVEKSRKLSTTRDPEVKEYRRAIVSQLMPLLKSFPMVTNGQLRLEIA
ncbi:MAG: hypothetical protein K2X27_09730, partial [Candidatus Obscuribacterales bacterium]|nr:hypothetical protein [Candidatus Obscuribacterales bacterium]